MDVYLWWKTFIISARCGGVYQFNENPTYVL